MSPLAEVRRRVSRPGRRPFFPPVEDREDAEQGVFLRLLKKADANHLDLGQLVETDPACIDRAIEAERSKARRRLSHRPRQLSTFLERRLQARTEDWQTLLFPEDEMLSLITRSERIARVACLSPLEREVIHYCYGLGLSETAALSRTLRCRKQLVYDLKYRARKKILGCLGRIEELFGHE
jgi:hypothetical protein